MDTLARIQTVLSTKTATIAVLCIAIASRIIQLVFFYNIHFDPSYQVIATENLLNGHGITITRATIDNLAAPVYEPLIMWPPGYTFLLAPFYALFGHDYIAAGITLDILFALVLIVCCRAILRTLSTDVWIINLFTLFSGFFIYFFYFLASSDAIAISFFAVALLYTLKIVKNQTAPAKHIFLISIALAFVALLKYMYMPVAVIIPLFLIVAGFATKQSAFTKTGFIALALVLITVAGTLVYQKTAGGQAVYISAAGRGFYPQHLLETYPFIPASFFNPASVSSLPAGKQWEQVILTGFRIINWILFIALLVFALRYFKKNRLTALTAKRSFFYIAVLLLIAVVSLLAFLSVRVEKEQVRPGVWWTYVEEPRYYGLITVLLHLAFFGLLQFYVRTKRQAVKYLLLFFTLLLLPEFFRGIVFTTKRLINAGSEEYSWQWENRFQQYAGNIIQQEKKTTQQANVVIAGPVYYLNNRVSIYSHAAALHDATALHDLTKLKASAHTLLLVAIDKDNLAAFSDFTTNPSVILAGQFEQFYFYKLYVGPR